MRIAIPVRTVGAIFVAASAVLTPVMPTSALQPAGPMSVTVCHFPKEPLAYAKPNPKYPFKFLLSTAQRNSTNRKVRRAVRSIQAVLQRIGIRDGSGRQVVVDGSYGPQTASAIRRFQQRKNLIVDGKVGQQTWRRLSKSCWLFH